MPRTKKTEQEPKSDTTLMVIPEPTPENNPLPLSSEEDTLVSPLPEAEIMSRIASEEEVTEESSDTFEPPAEELEATSETFNEAVSPASQENSTEDSIVEKEEIDEVPKPRTRRTRKKAPPEDEFLPSDESTAPIEQGSPATQSSHPLAKQPSRKLNSLLSPSILTIENNDQVETQEYREDLIWHEIHNAYRTRRILTGTLGGMEPTETGNLVVIVYYKEFRVVIPMKEMMITLPQGNQYNYGEQSTRQSKIVNNMLGADIDFVVKGIDSKTRSIVASRKDAMLKKRQNFYMETDAAGQYRIYEGRVVQARVIAVAEKVVRVEIFGVETSILARDLSWDWIGDAHERYSVGDKVLIRILSVKREAVDTLTVKADLKSVNGENARDNLSRCRVQGKYAGVITDIHKGMVFIRLSVGVNAVAHTCYDRRAPGKRDDVSFVVTHLDEEHNTAIGIITRIIRQHI